MKYSLLESNQPLETKTIQTYSTQIGEMQLTTVLVKVIYTDYSYFSIGVHSAACGRDADFRMISDVSRDEAEAVRLFRTVSEGAVMPCTLEYVLSDCIGIL